MKQTLAITMFMLTAARLFGAEPAVCKLMRRTYAPAVPFEAQFEQSVYWSVREKTSRNRGTIYVAPKNRFRVECTGETYVGDGATFWQYSRANNQVVIRNFGELNPAVRPSQLFTAFLSEYTFAEKSRAGGLVTLEWTDDGSGARDYQSITVETREADGVVTSLVLVDGNKNVQTYRFKKTVFGKEAPANTFTFEAPPNATVIDNRR